MTPALPCNFAGTRIERIPRDQGIEFSLAGRRGFPSEYSCQDPSPISSMVIYLQSGKGSYAAQLSPCPDPDSGQDRRSGQGRP